jgi:hypothetical protein
LLKAAAADDDRHSEQDEELALHVVGFLGHLTTN